MRRSDSIYRNKALIPAALVLDGGAVASVAMTSLGILSGTSAMGAAASIGGSLVVSGGAVLSRKLYKRGLERKRIQGLKDRFDADIAEERRQLDEWAENMRIRELPVDEAHRLAIEEYREKHKDEWQANVRRMRHLDERARAKRRASMTMPKHSDVGKNFPIDTQKTTSGIDQLHDQVDELVFQLGSDNEAQILWQTFVRVKKLTASYGVTGSGDMARIRVALAHLTHEMDRAHKILHKREAKQQAEIQRTKELMEDARKLLVKEHSEEPDYLEIDPATNEVMFREPPKPVGLHELRDSFIKKPLSGIIRVDDLGDGETSTVQSWHTPHRQFGTLTGIARADTDEAKRAAVREMFRAGVGSIELIEDLPEIVETDPLSPEEWQMEAQLRRQLQRG